jgi:hypothetical protein
MKRSVVILAGRVMIRADGIIRADADAIERILQNLDGCCHIKSD